MNSSTNGCPPGKRAQAVFRETWLRLQHAPWVERTLRQAGVVLEQEARASAEDPGESPRIGAALQAAALDVRYTQRFLEGLGQEPGLASPEAFQGGIAANAAEALGQIAAALERAGRTRL